jgi:hypothetical protein
MPASANGRRADSASDAQRTTHRRPIGQDDTRAADEEYVVLRKRIVDYPDASAKSCEY